MKNVLAPAKYFTGYDEPRYAIIWKDIPNARAVDVFTVGSEGEYHVGTFYSLDKEPSFKSRHIMYVDCLEYIFREFKRIYTNEHSTNRKVI